MLVSISGIFMHKYVHGYSERETRRLREQSTIIEDLLHHDTFFPKNNTVLEVGCGVGAQTLILARKNPEATIVSIDISRESLVKAEQLINSEQIKNVSFQCGNIMELDFPHESFDHIFICFVLEHLDDPAKALLELKRVLKPGGTITVIEGDHGSFFWHPETKEGRQVWDCLIKAQQHLGHDPLIGRKLYPLITDAGYKVTHISPRTIYGDGHNLDLMSESMTKIMIPMLESAKQQSLKLKLIDEATWIKGITDLQKAAISENSTFCYSWFKAMAVKQV